MIEGAVWSAAGMQVQSREIERERWSFEENSVQISRLLSHNFHPQGPRKQGR